MFCEFHGYDYVVDRLDTVRPDRHGNWEKVPHLLRNLTDCDYLFFLDADAVFYSFAIALHEELLPRWEPHHLMLFAADCGGEGYRWHPHSVNAGVCLARNTPETKGILKEWDLASDMPGLERWRWQWCLEQRVLMDDVFPKYQHQIKLLQDYYLMNGLYGQFVRHYIHVGLGAGTCPLDTDNVSQWRHRELEKLYHSPLMERNRVLYQSGKSGSRPSPRAGE